MELVFMWPQNTNELCRGLFIYYIKDHLNLLNAALCELKDADVCQRTIQTTIYKQS